MKKTSVSLVFLLIAAFAFAQAPDWQWATQAGGSGFEHGRRIAIDDDGNSYVTGWFEGTATFGTYSLTSSGENDIFVAKMDANGNWQWAVQVGGTNSDLGKSIAIDSAGNSYVTGHFVSIAVFGSTSLTCNGMEDIFIAKMDTNGNWLWAKQAGGTNSDLGKSIALDSAGNIYVTGHFEGTAIFGSTSLTSSGDTDIFVAKLDVDGNWLYAISAGGGCFDFGCSIALDSAGNSYVTGKFYGTATFGSASLTSCGDYDIFVAKMDADGNWQWATRAGGSSGDSGTSIVLDSAGNSYVTGEFKHTATFGFISLSLTSNEYPDIFLAKTDADGIWQWAKQAGGSSDDYSGCIVLDSTGNS